MATWLRVGTRAEIEARRVRRVIHGERRIGLFLFDDTLYALGDECPHRGAALSDGDLSPDGFVACPLHAWEYNLKTGRGREDWEGCVARFPIEERDGAVYVWDEPLSNP